MKKFISVLLTMILALSLLTGCGQPAPPAEETEKPQEEAQLPEEAAEEKPETREFTDSCGRTLSIPAEVSKIAVSGPLAQIYVLPVAGDMLVGVSKSFNGDAQMYLPEEIFNKTEIGQLYGGKGEMDLEALLAAAPDLVVEVGEAKKTIAEDMDSLTQQTGIPFFHIDATVATAPEAYHMLGELLGQK